MEKELFYGYDIEAIVSDERLRPIDIFMFIHLIRISVNPATHQQIFHGEIEYDVPLSLLTKETHISKGHIGEVLRRLDEHGYIKLSLVPGATNRNSYHVIMYGRKKTETGS